MAKLVLEYDDAFYGEVCESFAKKYHRAETIADPNDAAKAVPNPVTKEEFFRDQVEEYIMAIYESAQLDAVDTFREETLKKVRDKVKDKRQKKVKVK
jgi:dsRNA-specific ribonuclease